MLRLSTGDVSEITGMPAQSIIGWCNRGVLQNAAEGSGQYRTWTLVQTLAIAYAMNWRLAGCDGAMLRNIAQFIAAMKESELRRELAAGRTLVLPDPNNPRLIAPDPETPCYKLDLAATLEDVENKISEIRNRPTRLGGGRFRGLNAR